jgi:hypothetical protein
MRFIIVIATFITCTHSSMVYGASTEQTARFDGQGNGTGPSASETRDNDAVIAGMCDGCAILPTSNSFADCTNPKCHSSSMRGALPERHENQTGKEKSK